MNTRNPKKNKIIYVGAFELPDKNAAAQRVCSVGKIFNELEYEVYYLGIDKYILSNRFNKIIYKGKLENEKLKYWVRKYPSNIAEWVYYLISIKQIKELISILKKETIFAIVAYNFPAIPLERLRRLCKKYKIYLIADCTEWYGKTYNNILKNILKYIDTKMRMEFFHKKLDGIICISTYLLNYYKKYKKNLIYLPPVIDIMDKKWCKNIYFKKNEGITLIYAGIPGYQKDRIDLIIKYLADPNFEKFNFILKIIGTSKEDLIFKQPLIRNYIIRLGDKIKFIGKISHQKVLYNIKNADFAIFFRDYCRVSSAGFPTKFVEAITCGTPVITNETSDIKYFLIPGVNGFLLNLNSKENTIKILSSALSINNSQLAFMKAQTSINNPFYYKIYINDIGKFLNNFK